MLTVVRVNQKRKLPLNRFLALATLDQTRCAKALKSQLLQQVEMQTNTHGHINIGMVQRLKYQM